MSKIQDTIEFDIHSEEVVTNTTVKIIVRVTAFADLLVAPRHTDGTLSLADARDIIERGTNPEDALKTEIRKALNSFIQANWELSNPSKCQEAGMEKVAIMASARVPERENYNLGSRLKAASRPGLTIAIVDTDVSIPSSMIEEAEQRLRKTILVRAIEEAKSLSEAAGVTYRVHNLSFRRDPLDISTYVATAISADASPSLDDGILGHSQKLVLTGHVTLATIVANG